MLTLLDEPLNLCESIHTVLATAATEAAAKGLELQLNYAPDLPLNIMGDPVRLQQILNNLISNAIKFTETGQVVVDASLGGGEATSEPRLLISVEDTGIGIAAAELRPRPALNIMGDRFACSKSSIT